MGFLKFFRGFLVILAIVTALFLLGVVFKVQIATALGKYLVYEDTLTEVDAAFVLAGMPTERLPYAQKLEKQNLFPKLVVTGERIDPDLKIIGMPMTDAQVAQKVLIEMGVDSTKIISLPEGTSTYEESESILGFSEAEGYKRIMVISSKLHTRRVKNTFKKKFSDAGIEVVIRGADPLDYKLDQWWLSEQGIIFVFNEYAKQIYYNLTY